MSFSVSNEQFVKSAKVAIGNLMIGGDQPIVVQSMTTTHTMDVVATIEQIMRLADTGCEMVRITTQNIKEAQLLSKIKNELLKRSYHLPLVADVHFNPKVAEVAAQIVEKVRINPGNYVDRNNLKIDFAKKEYQLELEKIGEKLSPLLDICKRNHTAIRIGTNHGSLSNRILAKYGNTALGMVESALEFVEICRQHNFKDLILSIKSSNVRTMIGSNKLLVEKMMARGYYFPIHLGVTEAGDGIDARIKSAAGIGNLLMNGIGDTIRVSLTEKPENEIPVARQLVEWYGKKKSDATEIKAKKIVLKSKIEQAISEKLKPPFVISIGQSEFADFTLKKNNILFSNKESIAVETKPYSSSNDENMILKLDYSDLSVDVLQLRAAAEFSYFNDMSPLKGICINNNFTSDSENDQLSLDILQSMGLRFTKAELIACPSCGRTYFDIQDHIKKIREMTSHLNGIKIAIMGCIVNGPGEMADADYGYIGSGIGKVSLYKGSALIYQKIDEKEAIDHLISLIKDSGDWKD